MRAWFEELLGLIVWCVLPALVVALLIIGPIALADAWGWIG